MIKSDQVWSNLIKFDQVWTSLIKFDQVWTSLIKFEHVWASLNQFNPFWSNSIKFDQVWSSLNNMFQNSSEMLQIFQKCWRWRLWRRRKAIPKTASEALLAVKKIYEDIMNSIPSPSSWVKIQIKIEKVCIGCKDNKLFVLTSQTNYVSHPWFEFSPKVKVIGSNPSYLLKSFLLYLSHYQYFHR